MFRIYDGREHFYQWDLNRKLIVEDAGVKEVHFCNRTDNCSLVCETYVEGDFTLVNVPNILLQTDWKIRVYAYDGAYTKHDECYEVKGRTKPADYVYTETEVLDYKDLEDRIKAIEENGGGGTGAVSSVNGKVGEVVLSAEDVGAYTKIESHRLVSTLIDSMVMPFLNEKANKYDVYTKDEVDSKLSSVYKFKGTIDYYSQVPANPDIGDVYNIEYDSEYYPDLIHLTLITGLYNMDSENGIYLQFQTDKTVSFNEKEDTFFFKERESASVYPSIEIETACIKGVNQDSIELQFSPNNLNYDLIKDIFFPGHVINPDGGMTEISEAYPCEIWQKVITVNAGDNVAWTGTEWDALGGTVDMGDMDAALDAIIAIQNELLEV